MLLSKAFSVLVILGTTSVSALPFDARDTGSLSNPSYAEAPQAYEVPEARDFAPDDLEARGFLDFIPKIFDIIPKIADGVVSKIQGNNGQGQKQKRELSDEDVADVHEMVARAMDESEEYGYAKRDSQGQAQVVSALVGAINDRLAGGHPKRDFAPGDLEARGGLGSILGDIFGLIPNIADKVVNGITGNNGQGQKQKRELSDEDVADVHEMVARAMDESEEYGYAKRDSQGQAQVVSALVGAINDRLAGGHPKRDSQGQDKVVSALVGAINDRLANGHQKRDPKFTLPKIPTRIGVIPITKPKPDGWWDTFGHVGKDWAKKHGADQLDQWLNDHKQTQTQTQNQNQNQNQNADQNQDQNQNQTQNQDQNANAGSNNKRDVKSPDNAPYVLQARQAEIAAEAVGGAVTAGIDAIKKAVSHNSQVDQNNRGDIVKAFLREHINKFPNRNVFIYHQFHNDFTWNVAENADKVEDQFQVKRKDVPGTTEYYKIVSFDGDGYIEKGLNSDGGYVNWAYWGNVVDRSNADNKITFKKIDNPNAMSKDIPN